jgi:preprotein translocase subunit YajC
MMNKLIFKLSSVALIAAAPIAAAAAQGGATAISVGMPVIDVSGAPVGVIASRKGDSVTLKTDHYEIPLGVGSFTVQDGKAYFAMTRAQANAEYEKLQAAAKASLVPGAVVKGLAGTKIGTIVSIDETNVTIKLESGQSVILPRSGIAGGPDGAVVGITAEELAKKVSGN